MDLMQKEINVIEFLAKMFVQMIHNRLKKAYGDSVMEISNVRVLDKKLTNGE